MAAVSGAPTSAATGSRCPPIETFGQRAIRAREIGLAHPETNDGELGSGEGDEDAERVEAREEGRVAAGRKLRQQR